MTTQPNILFILSDDHGFWGMHCAGTPELYTPNLDRLARNGINCNNFFCVSPVCSPARASLLTGTIPSAHGVHDWILSGNLDANRFQTQLKECPYSCAQERLPISYLDGQTTYTDILFEHGYTCALSGKWHLGNSALPQHGFSKWFTIGKGGCHYYHADVIENGQLSIAHGTYITEYITDKALTYLDELCQKDNPFYLSVHYTAPHDPWSAENHPQKWIDYYKNCSFESIPNVPDHPHLTTGPVYHTPRRRENLIGYFAAISAMDEQIGRLLDKLEQEHMLENTLVIFTADNGMSMGHHGIWGKGNGTFPFNMFDTAVKVPFLAYWPNHIPAGITTDELLSAYDIFPTLLDIANITDTSYNGPGTSFTSLLFGNHISTQNHAIVIYDEYGPVRMIRTKEWKYVHRYPYGPHEFYDLKNDPTEENNLITNSNYEWIIIQMRRTLENWFSQYVNPSLDGVKEGVTGGGQLCLAGTNADRLCIYGPL